MTVTNVNFFYKRPGVTSLLAISRAAVFHCVSQPACQRRLPSAFSCSHGPAQPLGYMSETIEGEKMRQRSERMNRDRPSYITLQGIA